MKTVQFRVDENYLDTVLTLLNNLRLDIVKDLSVFKENREKIDKDEVLKKFLAVDSLLNHSDKTDEFLKLGGSNCWSGNLEDMRENRVSYDSY